MEADDSDVTLMSIDLERITEANESTLSSIDLEGIMEAGEKSPSITRVCAHRRRLEDLADTLEKRQRLSDGGDLQHAFQHSQLELTPKCAAKLSASCATEHRRLSEQRAEAPTLRQHRGANLQQAQREVSEFYRYRGGNLQEAPQLHSLAVLPQDLEVPLPTAGKYEEQAPRLDAGALRKRGLVCAATETCSLDAIQNTGISQRSRVQDTIAWSRRLSQGMDERLALAKSSVEVAAAQLSRMQGPSTLRLKAANAGDATKQRQSERDEAAKQVEDARLDFIQCEGWVGDLRDFFERGCAARDSEAIIRGLQRAMPEADVLPVVVQALLAQAQGSMDLASPSVAAIRDRVDANIVGMFGRLQQRLEELQARKMSCESAVEEAFRRQKVLVKQFRHAFAEVCPDTGAESGAEIGMVGSPVPFRQQDHQQKAICSEL